MQISFYRNGAKIRADVCGCYANLAFQDRAAGDIIACSADIYHASGAEFVQRANPTELCPCGASAAGAHEHRS
jgi:hypothetical protein